jgi:hypothetical protein
MRCDSTASVVRHGRDLRSAKRWQYVKHGRKSDMDLCACEHIRGESAISNTLGSTHPFRNLSEDLHRVRKVKGQIHIYRWKDDGGTLYASTNCVVQNYTTYQHRISVSVKCTYQCQEGIPPPRGKDHSFRLGFFHGGGGLHYRV